MIKTQSRARQVAMAVVNGINAAQLPKSALQMSLKQIRAGWHVTLDEAQEIRWILTENWK